jgi:hypothetical protein
MPRTPAIWFLAAAVVVAGCTDRNEAVRAAQPHLERFGGLRVRALELLELRSGIERNKLLVQAARGAEGELPENLRPVFEQMRAERVELTEDQLKRDEALFWTVLDRTFSEAPDVVMAEILFLEGDGSVSSFRSPRELELPAGVRWHGLREQRTFAGLARCVTVEGSEPCVLVQLRPRDYPGSAGLTVAFRRGD